MDNNNLCCDGVKQKKKTGARKKKKKNMKEQTNVLLKLFYTQLRHNQGFTDVFTLIGEKKQCTKTKNF